MEEMVERQRTVKAAREERPVTVLSGAREEMVEIQRTVTVAQQERAVEVSKAAMAAMAVMPRQELAVRVV